MLRAEIHSPSLQTVEKCPQKDRFIVAENKQSNATSEQGTHSTSDKKAPTSSPLSTAPSTDQPHQHQSDQQQPAPSDMQLDSYRIELDAYSGPLDLLMYLVRRHEIDLNDIPISKLTAQYIAHIEMLKEIDVNLAGDFLVMAATLLEIKSKMIIPEDIEDDHEKDQHQNKKEETADPRFELVQQLLAYKKYKDAAMDLEQQMQQWEKRYPLKPTKYKKTDRLGFEQEAEDAQEKVVELDDANMMDLCNAFTRILESIGLRDYKHQVIYDDTPIALHAEDVFDRVKRDGGASQQLTLQKIFQGRSRSEAVGLFLATLELVRQKRLIVVQDAGGGEIGLAIREKEDFDPDAVVDWKDPKTGKIQYDWPTPESRKRAQRRDKIRATRARNEKIRQDLETQFPQGIPEQELIKAGLLKVTKERKKQDQPPPRLGPIKLGQAAPQTTMNPNHTIQQLETDKLESDDLEMDELENNDLALDGLEADDLKNDAVQAPLAENPTNNHSAHPSQNSEPQQ